MFEKNINKLISIDEKENRLFLSHVMSLKMLMVADSSSEIIINV